MRLKLGYQTVLRVHERLSSAGSIHASYSRAPEFRFRVGAETEHPE